MLAIRPVGFGLGLRRAFLSTARLSCARAALETSARPCLPFEATPPPLYTLLYLTRCVPFFEAYREHPLQIHPRHTNNTLVASSSLLWVRKNKKTKEKEKEEKR
jgi:hypothetical protein